MMPERVFSYAGPASAAVACCLALIGCADKNDAQSIVSAEQLSKESPCVQKKVRDRLGSRLATPVSHRELDEIADECKRVATLRDSAQQWESQYKAVGGDLPQNTLDAGNDADVKTEEVAHPIPVLKASTALEACKVIVTKYRAPDGEVYWDSSIDSCKTASTSEQSKS